MQQEVIEGYRLSPQQEYLWLLCQQDGAAYRTQCALRIDGELQKSFLKEAFHQVVEQHEILRTAFRGAPGMNLPLQVILEHSGWSWREVDLREFAEEEQCTRLAALQQRESEREFNHEQGEVLYACLVMLAPDRHVLMLNISPLCADSWSLQNLVRELGRRYMAQLSGAEVEIEAVQYADFSEWQHKLLNTEDSAGRDFWAQQNVSDVPVLRLPLEKDAGEKYRPQYLALKNEPELVAQLEALARSYDVSLSEVLLAAWASLLWRLTGERELVIGAAVDGGRYKELHESLGLFTKYLPVPLKFAATSSFQEIIRRVAASYRDACRRQEYYAPGEERAAEEGMGYEYEEREETVVEYVPLRVAVLSEESCRSRQRVLLQCRYQRAAKRLELRLRYDGGCYSPQVIKLLAERLETWLQSVVRAPRAELSKVSLLGEAEHGLLRQWGTGAALERTEAYETLGEMLEQQAQQQGETAAVLGVDEVLTFSELNVRANQWGRYLRKRGVGPEAVVGILLERSSRMVECVCGVWKAGGAYLPLHPGTPPARLAQVLKQAGVRLVVSERDLAGLAGTGVEVIEWEAVYDEVSAEEVSEPKVAVSGENLAYVIYTSGSTGEPKGVMIEQRSVLHLLGGLRQEVYGGNDERCMRVGMNAPLSFDASVKQLVQVLRGKTLVVIPEELRLEAGPLLSYLEERAVDVLDCTPAQLRLLRAEASAGAKWPRLLLVGGEAIDGELWQQLGNWNETDSVNLYGPTEATVDTTWKRISGPSPSIGRPLPQVRLYLLDQHGEQVPIGHVGELYIGGRGVARGYRQAAELTAERFVPDGYGDEHGGRLYRTGDLVRYTIDGELEYVGRTDRQVKLRGFRIELEELEAVLLEHEGVKAAAAMVRRDDEEKEERLVAYVVPKQQQAAMLEGQGFSVVAKLEEQVVGGSALYQLPNKLEVFHHNRNETEHLYHQIFENQFYLKYGISIKPGDCIFDVGANIGLFTLFVYHQVRNATVYSFEPIPSNFEKLRNNVALYGLDVNLFDCGLSNRAGTATFTFYPNWSACSGVYANVEEEEEALKTFLINQGELVAEYADELIEGRYKGEQVVCQLRTLSEVIRQHNIERIDLLKLDVEKSEWDVLEGIEPADWQKIRQVVVEVHDLDGRLERMQQLLAHHGFVVEVEQEAGLVGTNIHSLYARRREAAGAELSEAHSANGNGTARLWRESVALGAAEADVSEAELRSYLRERLPEYMVPQVLVKLKRMPLSRHGKIDYQRLPAPGPVEGELKGELARSEVEKLMAGIWSEVLGLARVGREENFFELGGHSLLATQVMSRVREAFGVEMRLRELFERPTVKELGQSIERELRRGAGVPALPITSVDRDRELPLSFAQQRLWFIDQLEPGGIVYNVPVAVRLQGSLNPEALAQTLSEVIRRHEVLRTRFDTVSGRAVQVVEPAAPVQLEVEELSALEIEEREARVRVWAAQEAATPFDLSRGPLLRVKLLRLGEQEHVVLLTMHHIVSDGWSVGVLIKEVGTLYAAYVAGEESPLAELPIQYADFALWQRANLQGQMLEQQLAYWRRQLSDAPTLLDLPSDHPRPAVRSFRGSVERFELDQELSEKLRALSQRESVTLFMLLLAVFKVLLLKYAGQADIVIGADVANRNRAETENLIGFFVNMLVLRTDLSGNPTFRELLQRVREVCLEAYAHQDLPFEKLVEELQPERSLSYTPLFQVVFALQNAPLKDLQLPELTLTAVETESSTAKFDLVFRLVESDKRLAGNMEYSTDLFEAETIKRLLGHFRTLLAAAVADPAQQLSRLPLLTPAEEQQLAAWSDSSEEYPHEVIHQLFEAQVARTPEAVAVSFGEQAISYRELNTRANQLANYLQGLGSGPESLVALYLDRSPEMVIAILAVLKAGAAYLPLDLSSPAERVAFMLQDASASVLVTQDRFLEEVSAASAVTIVCLDTDQTRIAEQSAAPPESGIGPENLAYVIYTSGSSGAPKGTLITHANVTRLLAATHDVFHFDEQDVWTLFHSYAFDFSVWELFGPLLSGGRVVVVPYLVSRSPAEFYQLLQREQVTVLNQTPSAFRQLQVVDETEREQLALRLVIFGGEALELESLGGWFARHAERPQLVNMYGITETTVHVTMREVTKTDVENQAGSVIGRAINDLQLYVLDRGMKPVPVGVAGELYVGGAGLARGYLKRPALTAEKFVPHPSSARAGERLYGTGDVGRWRRDGGVEYLGRLDEQVKLRGFRVELGEIEAVLSRHAAVREAVVVVQTVNHDKRLVGYVVGEESLESGELRQYLKSLLPEYMVPQVLVQLERLPLTANGKVDRRALPAVEHVREETEMVEAQTPVEEVLVGIWSEVLGVPVGVADDFFELGGHSLLATQVMSRVREALGVEVALRELFERPTVKELGQTIERELRQGAEVGAPPLERRERVGELPLSFGQQRLWLIDQLAPGGTIYNLPAAVKLTGHLDVEALARTFTEVVRRHEVLRTRFPNVGGRAVQVVEEPGRIDLPLVDLSELAADEREAEAAKLTEAEAEQPFELSRGPLLRVKLLRLGEREHVVLLTMHHIVMDGWSLEILIREIVALYEAFIDGKPSPLEELPLQYTDFAAWQRAWLTGEVLEKQLAYWKEQMANAPAMLELPTDRPRPAVQTYRGATHSFAVRAEMVAALKGLSRCEDVTFFMTLLAAWKVLLARYTGQVDLLLGTPIANRNRRETEDLIGFFVNTLVLRTDLSGNPVFRELLKRVREVCLAAYAHQDLPFEKLVEELQPERSLSHTPLFQVSFALQNIPVDERSLPALSLSVMQTGHVTSKFDLTLLMAEEAGELKGSLEYNSDLFDAATIERLSEHFKNLLEAVVGNPDQRILSLPLLSKLERERLISQPRRWNDAESQCLPQLFEAQVERTPEATALVHETQRVSYRELNAHANQLAHCLQGLGVGPESLVALYLDRSVEMVSAILGILKAGAAYLPLDLSWPAERVAFILKDAGASVLLTETQLLERLPAGTDIALVCLDTEQGRFATESEENPASGTHPENLAYVIYTSGSTGQPKGSLITHANVSRLFSATEHLFRFDERDVWTLFHSYAFDFSVWEIFGPLLTGGRLVVVPYLVSRSPADFYELLLQEQVTVLNQTPSAFRQLMAVDEQHQQRAQLGLRLVIFGGEALEIQSLAGWYERHGDREPQLVNMYGITETTVHVTERELTKADVDHQAGSVIGRALADLQLYVLDGQMEPAPVGVAGELYVGGAGLARGYLKRAELTAEKFVPHPYSEDAGERLYRTGDVGRWLSDGGIEYLGRKDEQVKIRGFRIELGEIETALSRHPGAREAVVVAREDANSDKRLVAYIVPDQKYLSTIGDQALHQLPNDLSVFHLNKNETEHLYREIFQDCSYLKHGLTLSDGDCVFDIGANIGLFTLFAEQRCKNLQTFAFEPSPVAFEKLRLNVERYGLHASVFDCGLSNKEGSATFTYYPQASVMSGFYPNEGEEKELFRAFMLNQPHAGGDDERALLSEYADELTDARFESQSFTCRLRTISSIIAEYNIQCVDLLKVDVEKSEADVLEGINEDDWHKIKQVVVEVHDIDGRLNRVLSLLRKHGFEIAQEVLAEGTGVYNIFARRERGNGFQASHNGKATLQNLKVVDHYTLSSGDLRAYLKETLPDYMVPSSFVMLEKLPLTSNGKVDRRALPAPQYTRTDLARDYAGPRTLTEEMLANIWLAILGVEETGIDDNFFELGGHSLLATQLMSRVREAFGVEVSLRELFERPTIRQLGEGIEQALGKGAGVAAAPIMRADREQELPLSFAQQRLWFIDQLEPGGAFYNVPAAVRLKGSLNKEALEQTLSEVVRRHEVLRTRFATVSGRAVQVIEAAAPIELEVEELSALELEEREARVREWSAQEAATPFDLSRGPLLRVKLLRLGEQEHVVLLTLHHIVMDGWSMGIFIREIAALYEAFIEGRPSPLPELSIQYADFAVWQRAYLQGEVLEQQLKYWREQLAGAETVLKLPTDKSRPAINSYRGATHKFVLPEAVTAPLRKLSQEQGCTLFMTLLASFKTLLYRYTEQEDILVGTAIANRNRSETEGLIGFFVNTLVLRTDLSGDPSFRKLMQRVRETTLGAYVHQDMPFEKLVEELQPERSLSQAPLFQVAFGVHNTPLQTFTLPGLELSQMDSDFDAGRFDLTLWMSEYQDQLSGIWYYNTDLFEAATIKRMQGHFETLLQNVLAQPDVPLSEIEMLTADEKEQKIVQKRERLESNAQVLRTIKRKPAIAGASVKPGA